MQTFSIIIPVYNRPDEIEELLASLAAQTDTDFEVLVVEDGSTCRCDAVCAKYIDKLAIHYFYKPNSGRSDTRNFGMAHASGNYFIFFDSDCIIPAHYIETVRKHLNRQYVDCYGGPDSADASFSSLQKAISYSMTSFMTTGGIRGATKQVEKFSPRSFNMGLSRQVYDVIGGYKNMIGEDIDLSIRIKKAGFSTRLFPDTCVFHKRRVNLYKFYKQVNTFGKGRVLLHRIHPDSLKPVHLLPALFVIGHLGLLTAAVIAGDGRWLLPVALYCAAIPVESFIKNRQLKVALLSVVTSYIQLFGYGVGFITELLTHKASRATQEALYGR
ncbi:MAG: glycosyltransferase [Prevotellaceae bacterium]|nr:glycosyltransferase [Prevotellaceae bacterium]